MAIVGSNLTHDLPTNGASSYASSSITPTANALEILSVYSNHAGGGGNVPTVTGCGLTWVQIYSGVHTLDSAIMGTFFRAQGSSPSAGQLTVDFGGQTQTASQPGGITISVDEFTGVDTGGTNGSAAVVQAVGKNSNNSGTIAVTLAAFASASNGTWLGTVCGNGGGGAAAGSGFTLLSGGSNTAPFEAAEWRADNQTSPSMSIGGAATIDLGIEIGAATAGAAATRMLPTLGVGT